MAELITIGAFTLGGVFVGSFMTLLAVVAGRRTEKDATTNDTHIFNGMGEN